MENYFIFNGVSSKEYGIKCSNPPIIIPKKNMKRINVEGRSGSLTIDEESYNDIYKTIKCRIYGSSNIALITKWLMGRGRLIVSSEPEKYYKGYISKDIEIKYILEDYRGFEITFCCSPFKYFIDSKGDFLETKKSPFLFYGKGNISALPYIKIYGSGNISLMINKREIKFKNVSEYIEIDSEIMNCFKENKNMNKYMVGDFPKLSPLGEKNEITFTGNVTKVEIEPRWREV